MTCGFLIQLVFTSSHQSASPFHSGAPPPRKNPGFTSDYTLKLNARFTLRPVFFLLEYRDKKQSLKQRKVVSETQLPCQISAINFIAIPRQSNSVCFARRRQRQNLLMICAHWGSAQLRYCIYFILSPEERLREKTIPI